MQDCLARFGDGIGCQIARTGEYPYDCEYNGTLIRCSGLKNKRIQWEDGVSTRLWFVRQATEADRRRLRSLGRHGADVLFTDERKGRWWGGIFAKGNLRLTNEVTGNTIFIPHAPACRSPLVGTVGYCALPK